MSIRMCSITMTIYQNGNIECQDRGGGGGGGGLEFAGGD